MFDTIIIYIFAMLILLTIFFFLSWLLIGFAIYFLPLIIAFIRNHKNIFAIAILNIMLGWTLVGWFGALLWSLNSDITEEEDL